MKLKYTLTLICSLFIYAGFSQIHLWTKVWGTDGFESMRSIVRGTDGSLYLAMSLSEETDIDLSDEEYIISPEGHFDNVIAKYNHSGELQWAFNLGDGDKSQGLMRIELDPDGNLIGFSKADGSVDYDPSDEDYVLNANNDVCVFKYSSEGELIFVHLINAIYETMRLDQDGNILMTGSFTGEVDFDPSAGESILDSEEGNRYLLKLDNDGDYLWARNIGRNENPVVVNDLGINSENDIYVVGFFNDTLFYNVDGSEVYSVSEDGSDGAILKYSSDGEIVWGAVLGGDAAQRYQSIVIDNSDNLIIGGKNGGEADFDFGAGTDVMEATNLILFIHKLNSDHEHVWVGGMETNGTSADCNFGEFITDQYGDIYFTCDIVADAFDANPGPETQNTPSWDDFPDVLFSKWANDGEFVWANTYGRVGYDDAERIVIDEVGSIYIVGTYEDNCDFDLGEGTNFVDAVGYRDIYLSKYYQGLTGIEPTPVFDGISIYPNPTAGTFTISGLTAGDQVEVYSLNGELLMQNQAININHEISLSHLADGVYLVKVVNNASSRMVKVVKG